jgi:uncharacterized membrane protein YeaQ/YmgE (transglycosylase-associated protein family)
MEFIATLLMGALAGWLGAVVYKDRKLGLAGNITIGILGSFIGLWLFGYMGASLDEGLLGVILTSALGAIIILALVNLLLRK